MFRIPDCTTALTAANVAFLEGSLTGLQHPLSIIQGPDNGVCQNSVRRALRGEIPVLNAATALMKAVETKHLDWIQNGLVDREGRAVCIVEKVERILLREVADPPPPVRAFLESHPSSDLEITEVTTSFEEHTEGLTQIEFRKYKGRVDSEILSHNLHAELMNLSGLKNLYRPFIHAERSRLWRHVPLPLILGAMQTAFGENAVNPQFVTGAVPLDFIRDLLNDDGWPIAIPSGPPESGEPDDPGYFNVHGPGRDAYWTLLHDVWHALTWCGRPLPRRREVIRQHDLFTGVMKRVPDAYHGLMAFTELRDALLGGSLEEERILRFLDSYLETDVKEGRLPSNVADRVLAEYGERLRRSAPSGNPPGG